MKRLWIVSFACLLLVCSGFAQAQEIAVSLKLDKEVNGPTPVCVPLTLSADQAKLSVVSSGKILGQLTAPGLSTEQIKPDDKVSKGVRRDLHFILSDKAAAGATLSLKFTPAPLGGDRVEFNFKDKKGEYCDLCFGDRPILRYMYKAYDASTGDIRLKTYKPFHHVFDPTGKQIVTNGGFTDEREKGKNLTFPHHRGLMLGFMRISYDDGKKMDSWHCPNDNHQLHEGFLSSETGPVLGRQRIANVWYAAKKEPVVREERELTVYNVPGGTLIEFASLLKADHGKVTLNGDPQHAGFQFRAHNDVASNTKETYYVRPDGKGQLGEERNSRKEMTDLPWDALSYVLKGQRYTVCYLDQPKNPHPAHYSERTYGRFGCYFVRDITPDQSVLLDYRIWLQQGEMTGEQVQALADRFVSPPVIAK